MNKYKQSERALRRIRQKIFDYPIQLEEKADRVLKYLKSRVLRDRKIEVQNRPFKHWMYACE